jgi:hypothetical protein
MATVATKPEIPFNERTLQAFSKEGLEAPSAYGIKRRHDMFRAKYKPANGPLQVIIRQMVRQPVITIDEKGNAVKKDYLTYSFDVIAKDWLGNEMRVPDVEGYYTKPKFHTTTRLNPETGDHIEEKRHNGSIKVYDIELTEKNRKKIIEDIINKSTGTIIDGITFYGKFPDSPLGKGFRCNLYTYDQFINSSIEELEKLGRKEGGPQGNAPYQGKDAKPYIH